MSQVGPVTPVAAQLVGLVSNNLNQAADRRLQLARLKAEREMQKSTLDAQTALQEAELRAQDELARRKEQLERDTSKQQMESFAARNASEERVAAAQLAQRQQEAVMEQEEADKERKHQEAMAAQHERFTRERDAALARAEQAKLTGQREAFDSLMGDVRANEEKMDDWASRQAALRASKALIERQSLDSVPEMRRRFEDIVAGADQTRNDIDAAVRASVVGALRDVSADKATSREFNQLLEAGDTHAAVRMFALRVLNTPEMGAALSHAASPGAARDAIGDFVLAVAGVQTASSSGRLVSTRDPVEALERARQVIDEETLAAIVDSMGRYADFAGEGAEMFRANGVIGADGQWALKTSPKVQTRMEDTFRMLGSVDLRTRKMGLATLAGRGKSAVASLDMAVAAFNAADPDGFNTAIEKLRKTHGDGVASKLLEHLKPASESLRRMAELREEERALGEEQFAIQREGTRLQTAMVDADLRAREAGAKVLAESLTTPFQGR